MLNCVHSVHKQRTNFVKKHRFEKSEKFGKIIKIVGYRLTSEFWWKNGRISVNKW